MYHWLTVAQAYYYLANVMTVLNSSFCQFIEYQDAHANLLTENTDFILNSVCNLLLFGKSCT